MLVLYSTNNPIIWTNLTKIATKREAGLDMLILLAGRHESKEQFILEAAKVAVNPTSLKYSSSKLDPILFLLRKICESSQEVENRATLMALSKQIERLKGSPLLRKI
ncbi:hypothetical protein [Candidatus Odyssella acanthamoebae]|uniref:Uncharacterized protein n=1 Tax=Candidatus Odyssella acanthamoebae TaxID=91604 RepID=A0A077AW10_9PROT|nr:hypothetical protein [Candidatus Paracaedibacter acanthamoebae]AIK96234.1 hypothetical protein ID47_04970 [Candidatus Paracaedibacter acanthamoebae]